MKNVALILGMVVTLSSCQPDKKLDKIPQTFSGPAIGTSYNITLFSDELEDVDPVVDSIVNYFNNSMSTYQSDSRISRFNRGTDPTVIDTVFANVYRRARDISQKTNGYFDPTVGPLVRAYGFGPDGATSAPDQNQIDSLMNLVGTELIDMRRIASDSFLISKKWKGVQLDFNAIAKGTLVDHIAAELENRGITNYLVEVGGEVTTSGQNLEKESAWTVGIDDPFQTPDMRGLIMAINLEDKAMAGSGNYRKKRKSDSSERVLVHTVNPLTGMAFQTEVMAVNVVANDCTTADAYATALMAMPLDEGIDYLSKIEDIDGVIMYSDDQGELQMEMTEGFKSLIINEFSAPRE